MSSFLSHRSALLKGGIVLCLLLGQKVMAQDLQADNMLLFQREVGGWSKHYNEKAVDYKRSYTASEKADIKDNAGRNDATIDNHATTKEIGYLLQTYQKTPNKDYLAAAEKGIRYLLKAQYENGGWPQYYPDLSSYRHEITYNDNAMVDVLNVLKSVAAHKNEYAAVDEKLIAPSQKAIEKGIDCILKTQVVVNGKLTVWCAQHDEKTLQPAKARAFELASLSGAESVGIVEFLMQVPNPSPAIKKSINSAVQWFETAKIKGIKVVDVPDASKPKGFERTVVPDENSVIWARFYEIATNEPFFCGRDGVKKTNLSDIEYERRTGYAYYGNWPAKILDKKYPEWQKKNPS